MGGSILKKPEEPYQVSSVAKIVPLPDKKELHVLCENGLQVVIVRGTKVFIKDYHLAFIKSVEHFKDSQQCK